MVMGSLLLKGLAAMAALVATQPGDSSRDVVPIASYGLAGPDPLGDQAAEAADLVVQGEVAFVEGAARFAGFGALEASAAKLQPTRRTWTAWARFKYQKGQATQMAIADHSGTDRSGWFLRVHADGEFAGAIEGGVGFLDPSTGQTGYLSLRSDALVNPDTWYEVALVCDPDNALSHVRLFVDKSLVKAVRVPDLARPSNVYAPSAGVLRLGQHGNSKSHRLVGEISHVRIYGEALTDEQVAAIVAGPAAAGGEAGGGFIRGQVIAADAAAGLLTVRHMVRRDGRLGPVCDEFQVDGASRPGILDQMSGLSVGDYVLVTFQNGPDQRRQLIALTRSEVGNKDEEG